MGFHDRDNGAYRPYATRSIYRQRQPIFYRDRLQSNILMESEAKIVNGTRPLSERSSAIEINDGD